MITSLFVIALMDINAWLYAKINASAGKSKTLDFFGLVGGEAAIFVMLFWYAAGAWLAPRAPGAMVRPFIVLALAGLAGLALDFLIGWIIHEPRPFLDGKSRSLFHPLFPSLFKWKSFPSDHAMWAFVIFFCALILHLPFSWPLLLLALWVGWGRVYAGVHYPVDIVGGFAVAAFVASLVKWLVG